MKFAFCLFACLSFFSLDAMNYQERNCPSPKCVDDRKSLTRADLQEDSFCPVTSDKIRKYCISPALVETPSPEPEKPTK